MLDGCQKGVIENDVLFNSWKLSLNWRGIWVVVEFIFPTSESKCQAVTLEQEIEQGERKAPLEALHQTLTIRFKVDRAKFDAPLARLTVDSLKKLNEIALTAPTLPAFEEALTEMLSTPEKPASPSNDALTDE